MITKTKPRVFVDASLAWENETIPWVPGIETLTEQEAVRRVIMLMHFTALDPVYMEITPEYSTGPVNRSPWADGSPRAVSIEGNFAWYAASFQIDEVSDESIALMEKAWAHHQKTYHYRLARMLMHIRKHLARQYGKVFMETHDLNAAEYHRREVSKRWHPRLMKGQRRLEEITPNWETVHHGDLSLLPYLQ